MSYQRQGLHSLFKQGSVYFVVIQGPDMRFTGPLVLWFRFKLWILVCFILSPSSKSILEEVSKGSKQKHYIVCKNDHEYTGEKKTKQSGRK